MVRKKKAIPQSIKRIVVQRDKGTCKHCGKQGKVHHYANPLGVTNEHELDYVFPEYSGGRATVENIVIACQKSNRSKGYKTLKEWGKILLPVGDENG